MSLHIDNSTAAFVSYRNLAVAPADVERSLAQLQAWTRFEPSPAAVDSVETRGTSRSDALSSALRSAQEAIGINEEASRTLGRAYDILVTLRGLVAQGIVDGHPPAETAAEQRYLSLVSELADLGRSAPVFDRPLPTRVDLTQIAGELGGSAGSGLDTALATVERAQVSVNDDRHSLGRALGTLAVALENGAASKTRITDSTMAREAADLVRAGVLGNPHSAVLAQSTTPTEALRLLTG